MMMSSAQENENSRGNQKITRPTSAPESRVIVSSKRRVRRFAIPKRAKTRRSKRRQVELVPRGSHHDGCSRDRSVCQLLDSLHAFDLTWADARWPHPRAQGLDAPHAWRRPRLPAPRGRSPARWSPERGAACRRSPGRPTTNPRRDRARVGAGTARATGTARERTRTRTSAITTRWSPRCGCPCVTSGWATSARTSACCSRRSASLPAASSTRAPRGRSRGGNTTSGSPRRGTSASRLARLSRAPPPTPGTRSASGERRGTRRAARRGDSITRGHHHRLTGRETGRRSTRSRPSRRHEAAAKPTEVRCASRRIARRSQTPHPRAPRASVCLSWRSRSSPRRPPPRARRLRDRGATRFFRATVVRRSARRSNESSRTV